MNTNKNINNMGGSVALLVASLGVLVACGGGGGGGVGGGSPSPSPAPGPFTIGGTISGLEGTGLVIQDNAGDDLAVSANGSFTFATSLARGTNYNVSVKTPPSFPAQDCLLAGATGTASANVTTVAITCSKLPVAAAQADGGVHAATVTWSNPAAQSHNLYVSTARNCDFRNYTTCPDGAMLAGVSSPQTLKNLDNGKPYYFQLESVFANSAHGLSKVFGAQPNALAFNNRISAIAARNDGTSYVGGLFTRAGIVTGGAVPLDMAAGRLARPNFPVVVGAVYAVESDGQGGWYIGGDFQSVGGVVRTDLAHILADGTVDAAFDPEPNGVVNTLAHVGGTLYAGGSFTIVGKAARARLVALDSHGVPTAWAPDPNDTVYALKAAGGVLYAGGAFTTIGATTRNRLAAFNTSGAGDLTNWNPVANGPVDALDVSGTSIYAGGTFTFVGNALHVYAAEITDTGTVTGWDPGINGTGVYAIAATDTTIYLGGMFLSVNGTPRQDLAAVDKAGKLTSWDPVAANYILALKVVGNTVYAAGAFTVIGGAPRKFLAGIDGTTGAATAWNPDANDTAYALGASSGAEPEIYAGGQFKFLGGVTRNHLAQLDATGDLTPWDPDVGGEVLALAINGDTVYAGGIFASVGSDSRNHLAAIDANGKATSWNPDPNNVVHALLNVHGKLYAGGSFTKLVNSQLARSHLVSFDESGQITFDFSGVDVPDGSVYTIAPSDAGTSPTIYVGGEFIKIGNQQRAHIAAYSSNGALQNWNPGADADVLAIAVTGGTIYAGGAFAHFGGQFHFRLGAVDAAGFAANWHPDVNGTVHALGVSGNTIYAAGDFTQYGPSATANHVVKLDSIGGLLDWPAGADDNVDAMVIEGSRVYLGGTFNSLSGLPRSGFGVVNVNSGAPMP